MCFGCPEPIPPPTEKSKSYVLQLKIFIFLEIIFGIFFVVLGSFNIFFQSLMIALLLYMGYSSLMHFMQVIFFFMSLYISLPLFSAFAGRIQNNDPFFSKSNTLYDVVSLLYMLMNFYLMGLSFFCYREFKGIMKEGGLVQAQNDDGNSGGGGMFGGGGAYSGMPSNPPPQREETRPTQPQFQAFRGQGIAIGGR